jgi:hypothetical protein
MCDAAKVRALNDEFRQSLKGGRVVATRGILALPDLPTIVRRVREHSDFDEGNDPHLEHDFGAFMHDDQQVFWKIDAYDLDLKFGSPDPADSSVTTRVMTIMLAEEY